METIRHLLRAAKVLARDPGVPRWLRSLFVFGLLPIPLFFDEVALLLATGMMFVYHRHRVARAWAITRRSGEAVTEEGQRFPERVEDDDEPGGRIGPPPTQR
jgi:hypothetical protein